MEVIAPLIARIFAGKIASLILGKCECDKERRDCKISHPKMFEPGLLVQHAAATRHDQQVAQHPN